MRLRVILETIILSLGGYAYACKCSDPGTVKDSYDNATTVVHGKVISRKVVSFAKTIKTDREDEIRNTLRADKKKLQLFESDLIFEIKIQIIEKFKHNIGDTVTIYTAISGASCGYRFEMEKEYIVYASNKSYAYHFFLTQSLIKENVEKENTYWTNHCTRTTWYYSKEADELKKLRKQGR
jgi:hypothetical protein